MVYYGHAVLQLSIIDCCLFFLSLLKCQVEFWKEEVSRLEARIKKHDCLVLTLTCPHRYAFPIASWKSW